MITIYDKTTSALLAIKNESVHYVDLGFLDFGKGNIEPVIYFKYLSPVQTEGIIHAIARPYVHDKTTPMDEKIKAIVGSINGDNLVNDISIGQALRRDSSVNIVGGWKVHTTPWKNLTNIEGFHKILKRLEKKRERQIAARNERLQDEAFENLRGDYEIDDGIR